MLSLSRPLSRPGRGPVSHSSRRNAIRAAARRGEAYTLERLRDELDVVRNRPTHPGGASPRLGDGPNAMAEPSDDHPRGAEPGLAPPGRRGLRRRLRELWRTLAHARGSFTSPRTAATDARPVTSYGRGGSVMRVYLGLEWTRGGDR